MRQLPTRACLKKAFCKMCVTICGRFCPDEGVVAGYDNRIRAKYTAKWGVQIAGMLFQTRSSSLLYHYFSEFPTCSARDFFSIFFFSRSSRKKSESMMEHSS